MRQARRSRDVTPRRHVHAPAARPSRCGGLLADGVLDIGVHFGWDYHSAYHLKHSAALYEELVSRGFESPVARFADLKRTSGPLRRALETPDGEVEVRVSLFWGQPGTETDPDTDAGGRALEADMRASLAARDVIVFSGHSGPFYGFALANWKKTEEGDLEPRPPRWRPGPAPRPPAGCRRARPRGPRPRRARGGSARWGRARPARWPRLRGSVAWRWTTSTAETTSRPTQRAADGGRRDEPLGRLPRFAHQTPGGSASVR